MKKGIYFDCYSGISGDMVLGACLDLGVDEERLREELNKLHVDGFELSVKRIVKNGFTGTDVTIISPESGKPVDHTHEHSHGHEHDHTHEHSHRTLHEIREMILGSELDDTVKTMALDIFLVIAEAEAKVHGKPVEEVGFHEVGALDSIADICGAAICLHLLGVEQVYCSVVREGTGFIMCQHGQLPVPVPAVVNMMPGSGIVVKQTDEIHTELVTPTGFGILKGTKAICGPMPEMVVEAVGLGFGKRETGRLNGLRALLGNVMGAEEMPAVHSHEHGHTHSHGHSHTHGGHTHTHSPEHTIRLRNRLAKAIGHLERVKQMVEDERDCCDVLMQLAAVKSALNNTGKYILKEHMEHCLIEAVENKEFSEIEELNRAIEYFIK